jgi:anti-sigma B factor antagonist
MENEKIFAIATEGDVVVITFKAVSISNSSGIEAVSVEIREMIEADKPAKILVDFTDVRFFSSQLLGMLVDVWKRLKAHNGKMLISGINPQLSRVFRITSLDKIFQFHPDKESAMQAFSQN